MKHNNFSLGKNKNPIPNLDNKRNYKLHDHNLKHYQSLGLSEKP